MKFFFSLPRLIDIIHKKQINTMKTYLHLIALVSFLCWTACANKNVTTENTQELTSTKSVEGYDVAAVASSICSCLDEKAKAKQTTAKAKHTNLTAYKNACQKQAYAQHGVPNNKNIAISINNVLEKECGQYLTSKPFDKNKALEKKKSTANKKGKTKNGKIKPMLLKDETE